MTARAVRSSWRRIRSCFWRASTVPLVFSLTMALFLIWGNRVGNGEGGRVGRRVSSDRAGALDDDDFVVGLGAREKGREEGRKGGSLGRCDGACVRPSFPSYLCYPRTPSHPLIRRYMKKRRTILARCANLSVESVSAKFSSLGDVQATRKVLAFPPRESLKGRREGGMGEGSEVKFLSLRHTGSDAQARGEGMEGRMEDRGIKARTAARMSGASPDRAHNGCDPRPGR